MKKFPKVLGLAMLLTSAAMVPAIAQQTDSERADLTRYQKYAEAPVDHVRYFQINGFQYLAPDKVAIWFGVNKLYLLTVQTPCNNLAFANGIGLKPDAVSQLRLRHVRSSALQDREDRAGG